MTAAALKGFAVFEAAAKTDHENYSFEAIVTVGSFLLLLFLGLFLTFAG